MNGNGKHKYLLATGLASITVGFFVKAGQSVFYQTVARMRERCERYAEDNSMFAERSIPTREVTASMEKPY
jgi:hypothetical protein